MIVPTARLAEADGNSSATGPVGVRTAASVLGVGKAGLATAQGIRLLILDE